MPAEPNRDKQGRNSGIPSGRILSRVLLLAAGTALVWTVVSFERNSRLLENIAGRSGDSCLLSWGQTGGPDQKVCLDCHDGELAREAKQPDIRTHGPVWELSHLGEARGGAIDCPVCHLLDSVVADVHTWSDCQSCHPGYDSCILCHASKGSIAGANPHGVGWSDRESGLRDAGDGQSCKECHREF